MNQENLRINWSTYTPLSWLQWIIYHLNNIVEYNWVLYINKTWTNTIDNPSVDTTNWEVYIQKDIEVYNETPIWAINGSNVVFALAHTPVNWERIYLNWLRLRLNVDYTISTNIITMNSPPIAGDELLVDYNFI
jgi:hypothetical protein